MAWDVDDSCWCFNAAMAFLAILFLPIVYRLIQYFL
ncbi:MAG: hypothetical protein ACI9FB_003986 [Candidatus Azotimanducaceae bacterium]|jgi:hypothetical protein